MKTFKSLVLGMCMATALCTCLTQTTTAQTTSTGGQWKWEKGTIVVESPERPEGY